MDLKNFGAELSAAINAEMAEDLAAPDLGVYHYVGDNALTVPPAGAVRFAAGRILTRGMELVVDADLIEAGRDAHGHSNFEDLSEEAQVRAWGSVQLAPGAVSTNLTLSHEIAADAAQLVKQQEQERIRQDHAYGRKGKS